MTTFGSSGATITLPTTTDTLVGRATTDTLTNKTISGLLSTGNTDSTLGGESTRGKFSTTTVSNATSVVATLAVPSNSTQIIKVTANAYCTAGTSANGSFSRIVSFCVNNTAGTASAVGTLNTVSSSSAGLAAANITCTVSAANAIITVVGVATMNMTWSGLYEVNS